MWGRGQSGLLSCACGPNLPSSTRVSFSAASDDRHIAAYLPYDRQSLNVREYERKQGNMAIDVQAGFLRDAHGKKLLQPLPFGPKARLILMHLCSEAVRQKSATIEIADTFTGFVRGMGFSDSGGKKGPLTAFKQQLNALSACTIHISAWTGERARMKLSCRSKMSICGCRITPISAPFGPARSPSATPCSTACNATRSR